MLICARNVGLVSRNYSVIRTGQGDHNVSRSAHYRTDRNVIIISFVCLLSSTAPQGFTKIPSVSSATLREAAAVPRLVPSSGPLVRTPQRQRFRQEVGVFSYVKQYKHSPTWLTFLEDKFNFITNRTDRPATSSLANCCSRFSGHGEPGGQGRFRDDRFPRVPDDDG